MVVRNKRKQNKLEVKLTPTGRPKKIIEPYLAKARNLRKSLLHRIDNDLKHTTPSIKELEKWLKLDSYTCYYCMDHLDIAAVTIDHKNPITRKGTNQLSNLCFSCSDCNLAKGVLNELEFRSLLELIKTWDEDSKNSLLRRLKQGNYIYGKK